MQKEKKKQNKKLKQRLTIAALALVCLLALVLVKKLYLDKPRQSKIGDIELYGPYKVIKVVDGDTITIKMDGADTKVRMIGIDTPESVAPETSGKSNSDEGKQASDYLKKLIDQKNIYLEFDIGRTDQYGRILAYVYLSDKTSMVQEIMLSEGYAVVMTYQPNVKYADRFLEQQRQARQEEKGFWGSGFYE